MTTKKKALSKTKPRASAAKVKRLVGRRAQNKAAIRKRIVTAALSLFQTKGFDATTPKQLPARRALPKAPWNDQLLIARATDRGVIHTSRTLDLFQIG